MTKADREETRQMLHDILVGYVARVESAISITNVSLDNIDKHFIALNGSVAEHGRIINQYLPPTTDACPQTGVIREIRDNMISVRAVKKAIVISVTTTGAFLSIAYVVIKIIFG